MFRYWIECIKLFYRKSTMKLINYFIKNGYKLTQEFGKTKFAIAHPSYYPPGGHNGLDYAGKLGSAIMACHAGKVVRKKYHKYNGNYISLWNEDGCYATKYLHLSKFNCELGDYIKAGDIIGFCGNTGLSEGSHCHFGLYQTNKKGYIINKDNGFKGAINPQPYFIT